LLATIGKCCKLKRGLSSAVFMSCAFVMKTVAKYGRYVLLPCDMRLRSVEMVLLFTECSYLAIVSSPGLILEMGFKT